MLDLCASQAASRSTEETAFISGLRAEGSFTVEGNLKGANMHFRCWVTLLVSLALSSPSWSQYYQKHFPPQEFRSRWEKVFEKIGDKALAIVAGAPQVGGFLVPRQSNEFYYLSGIETPHSYLLMDGRDRRVTLFLPPRNERLERSEGKVLSAGDANLVKQLTGVDAVLETSALTRDGLGKILSASEGSVLFAPFSPAEGQGQSRHELLRANAAIASDYWDGRLSREGQFIQLLRSRYPRLEVRDLTPILDALRSVKSSREIALLRIASQLSGLALMEAMRSTEPGIYEYQLDAAARYIFQVNGARLEAYRSITASGTDNIYNAHYYRNTRQVQEGDLVLMDYAPDLYYYVSDVARMWPANGKFTPVQSELLGFVLRYRNEILKRIRPGVLVNQIRKEANTAMHPILEGTRFSKPIYEQAARKLVDTGGGVFSHPVGMAVHDVGSYRSGPLQPGHVFSVDPQLWVPEEKLYIRYEDTVVVTETGVENFTEFLPSGLEDIERLVAEKGMVQGVPAALVEGTLKVWR